MRTRSDISAYVSLLLSVLASLISLGGIAYASGTLTDRVAQSEKRLDQLDKVNERLATIEAKLDFLVGAQKRHDANGN